MIKKLYNNVKSFIPTKTVVVEKRLDKVPMHIVNSIRGLMLVSPITEWDDGYNDAIEDILKIIEG